MPQTSFALLTNLGRAKEAAALANGTVIDITHIAIGDGVTVPSGGETALYNQLALKTVVASGTVVGADNTAYFDAFLAAADGPYTIREAGLFDVDGDMIAIAHYDPPISKPVPSSGQTVEATIRLEVAFSNIANITISIDPSMQVALQRLTSLPWISVISMALATPPASPTPGDTYLIASSPTGAWSGQAGKITEYTSAGWAIITPKNGHGIGLPDGSVYVRIGGTYRKRGQVETAISKSGLTFSPSDMDQLAIAIRSNALNYKATGGTATALTGTFDPTLTVTDGLTLNIVPQFSNTGAATLLGAPILHRNGSPLIKGDLFAGMPVTVVRHSGSWYLTGVSYGEMLVPLTADTTFWIRSDGDDSHDGLTNTAGGAFQTILGAYNAIRSRYFANGFIVTLRIGLTGSYVGFTHGTWPGTVVLDGTGVTATITRITGDVQCVATVGQQLTVKNCVISGTAGANNRGVWCAGGILTMDTCTWISPGGTVYQHALVENGGSLYMLGNHSMSGNCATLFSAVGGSNIYLGNTAVAVQITLPGTPAFGTAAVYLFEQSLVMNRGCTFIGGATGPRYSGQTNSVFSTAGGGANFFPGNSAGSTSTGAQYV